MMYLKIDGFPMLTTGDGLGDATLDALARYVPTTLNSAVLMGLGTWVSSEPSVSQKVFE